MIKKISYGFSLIEFIVVIAMSLMLFAELFCIYLHNKQIFNRQNNLARAEENMRFAANILQKNISMAGFSGCGKINNLNFMNQTNEEFTLESSLQGYANGHLPRYLQHKVLLGTDVIEIKKADQEATLLATDVESGSISIKVLQNPAKENNQLLLIADCTQADLFLAKNWQGNLVHANASIMHNYRRDATAVSRYEMLAFFISDTGRKNEKGESIYGLYMDVNRGNKQELLEGIDAMQISYGIKGIYRNAAEIDNLHLWQEVQNVVIRLRLQNKAQDPWFKVYIKLQNRSV